MTPEAQRIAIAKACGWKVLDEPDTSGPCACYARDAKGELRCGIPDYLSDLNAMHEAEKVLTVSQEAEFAELLHELSPDCFSHLHKDFRAIHATAAQRAEAFLRTMARHARQ